MVLRIGEATTLTGGTEVRVVDVLHDSRCPAGADCVWAGDATVTMRVQPANGPAERVDLRVSSGPDHFVSAAGLRLSLERLEPVPTIGQSIDRERYRAAIAIAR